MIPKACMTVLFVLLLAQAHANTEKVIFVSPPAVSITTSGPSFEQLHLPSITPEKSSLRLSLPAAFPSEKQPRGLDTWYMLRSLNPSQRYEVRVCWAATQPTNFWLDVYNISHVFDTPDLIQRLAVFSESQQAIDRPESPGSEASEESLLFLRVQAAADFFSTNKTLMNSPPAVDVELILDPYLANALARSLLPTVVYVVALAVGSWILSGMIWKRLFSSTNKPHND
ncbi:hypothetical protein LTR35_015070 [Friedmanniomyces endolithicus]|uniref:Protein PBN1 n=1 Tax=Friedmanniomyces endolithicus TaxID=329885 RepID=A0AAN6FCS6_9PEZI|nr:hypothetical protein LTR35_015070 [Friedmanniomyces endolithicus]KAK0283473.1 hypothetical protein LTS00_011611 [Friedmanniomyces endolithicus]KAK0310261.1 hypothetical protein LTR82_014788 [Friedmanniomyces endolithicus]KAK0982913.1 hypothetical protein LTR54_014478 [Friedmanniomyces endolithicus]